MGEDKFINPYNFIPFPEKKAAAYGDTGRHTGVIDYTITAKTPLFIPNSSSDSVFEESEDNKDHKSYDFFSYEELEPGKRYDDSFHVPVIPGSEMRGVIRSVYETLTDSCMGILNDSIHPVKRTAEQFNPGLLYNGGNGTIKLYKAKSYAIVSVIDDKLKGKSDGTKIFFKKEKKKNNKNKTYYVAGEYGFSEDDRKFDSFGYLIKWGMGVNKRHYHLFEKDSNSNMVKEFTKENVKSSLENIIRSYLEQPALDQNNADAYKDYESAFMDFLRGRGSYFPVNYSKLSDNVIYLSPATFTKEVSSNTIGKLAGKFAPCQGSGQICPACDLFGYVNAKGDESHCSKIRFTDLYVTEKEDDEKSYYACKKITLPALGGPKLGNVDFYLKKPAGATFWSYDYHIKDKEVVMEDGELRGRKFYWHHRAVDFNKLPFKGVEKTNLNHTVRPVKADVSFSGKLYFDGISQKQMQQLIWLLNCEKEGLGFKLGSAKPLGLGSITCKVDGVHERKIELKNGFLRYAVESIAVPEDTYEEVGFSQSVKNAFYRMAGLSPTFGEKEITYPKTLNQKNQPNGEGFQWFITNHGGLKMKFNRKNMVIIHELENINTGDIGLPYLKKSEREKNNAVNRKGRFR